MRTALAVASPVIYNGTGGASGGGLVVGAAAAARAATVTKAKKGMVRTPSNGISVFSSRFAPLSTRSGTTMAKASHSR